MDSLIQFLIEWGYLGLFISSFIAGSVLPFSSETVLGACLLPPLGLDPVLAVAACGTGNVLGGMTCYWMGHFGRIEWIEKYAHVKREKLEQAQRFIRHKGAWMAFFGFVPILGSAICIALGMMRANPYITALAMAVGKVGRYVIVAWGVLQAAQAIM
jgi:membrane protein YqaA with SNARE-associated domain